MPPRLGELLVGSGLLTPEQLEKALRAQVMWGGRLGTNLIELGCVELDHLARALSTQHRLPAALAKHFEKVDRELQQLLSPDVAEKFSCVPLSRVGPERIIILATTGPLTPRALAIIADELVVEPSRLLPSVAAELRIRYHLERAYGIPRDTRFLRSKGKTIPPFPAFDRAPEFEPEPPSAVTGTRAFVPIPAPPVDPDLAPAPAPAPEPIPVLDLLYEIADEIHDLSDEVVDEDELRDRRRYVPTLADIAPPPEPKAPQLARMSLRRVAITTPPQGVPDEPIAASACATLKDATRAIRRATGRDRVAELVIEALDRFAPECQAALFLVLRNEVAIGWKGFARAGTPIPQVAVPIDQTGIVPGVVANHEPARCNADALAEIDTKLLHALGATTGDLAIVPITISGQVMCMIATALAADAPITVTESVAAAAAAAFARLMRDASR